MKHRHLLALAMIAAFLLILIGLFIALVSDHYTHHQIRLRCDTSSTPWKCQSDDPPPNLESTK